MPVSTFSPSCYKGHRGELGDREEQRKRPCPSFGPCHLLLLFPTRQMGVSSQHPDRPQATKTPKASFSMTVSQVLPLP